jgi:hypothetical protein
MQGVSSSCLVNSIILISKQEQVSKYKLEPVSHRLQTLPGPRIGKLGELKGVLEQSTNLSKKMSRTYRLSKRTKR